MKFETIDVHMLALAIACNTDASERDARHIINTVLLKQGRQHGHKCQNDQSAQDVCDGTYIEKVEDVIQLSEALRGVLALAGENREIARVIETALESHGL